MDTTYPVITVCGSMRYYKEMLDAAVMMTRNGWIVLMPFDTSYKDGIIADDVKVMLDDMHRRKIDMSSAIIVIGEHRGKSTTGQIEYARAQGKWVYELGFRIPPAQMAD
jgi:hypothetical protein